MGDVLGRTAWGVAFAVGFVWGVEHALWRRFIHRPLREGLGF